MKMLKRILIALIIIVLLAIVAGGLYVRHLSNRAVPDYEPDVAWPILKSEVTVYRDSVGKPHIFADHEEDLYAVTGYLMAQDRLWQMDLLRRVTLGRLSEIFGADFVDADHLLRALQFTEKSQMILEAIDQDEKQSILSFCEGVNYFIENHQKRLPFEFGVLGYKPDPWKPEHTLNLIGYMAWDLKSGWDELLLDELRTVLSQEQLDMLLPIHIRGENAVFSNDESGMLKNSLLAKSNLHELPVDIFSASNNWAVGPRKTESGMPILANDMHLGYNIPGIWYPLHQHVKNKLRVSGFAIPGAPVVVVGHNDSIAWGLTNTYVDNMDFYKETVNPDDTGQYRLDGTWKDFVMGHEAIATKSGDTLHRTLRFTHRGPVITGFKDLDAVVSMQWVGSEPSDEYGAIYKVNRAQNWNAFLASFKTFRSISQNVAYADREGNIGLLCAAGIPIRDRSIMFDLLPGDTSRYDWQGMVPFEELPVLFNPEKGFVSAANNRPVDASYKHHMGSWYSRPYRYNRINQLLRVDTLYSVEKMKLIQNDMVNLQARKILPDIIRVLENSNDLDTSLIKYVEKWKNWTYAMGTSSVEATVYELFTFIFMKNIFADEMGDEIFNRFKQNTSIFYTGMENVWQRKNAVWYDNINTTDTRESFTDIVKTSFTETIDSLHSWYGADQSNWAWGNLHRLTLKHPLATEDILDRVFKLNRGPYPLPGNRFTMPQYAYPLFDPDEIHHGASQRLIYDLSDWDRSYTIIPTGVSGIPASPYYCDQTAKYVNGEYLPDYFSPGKIKENAAMETRFLPE